ncbi:MAG: hypothetical protein EA362_04745 [Saprospirales bacterium]|nr:MAG: hypothetical protein EA362_04745 [Saprospirales bacterium]
MDFKTKQALVPAFLLYYRPKHTIYLLDNQIYINFFDFFNLNYPQNFYWKAKISSIIENGRNLLSSKLG